MNEHFDKAGATDSKRCMCSIKMKKLKQVNSPDHEFNSGINTKKRGSH